MRRVHVMFGALLAAGLAQSGCSDDTSGQCAAVYCDDTGCYACNTDTCSCWSIANVPCEAGCAQDEYCTDDGICAKRCTHDGQCDQGERCLADGYCSPAEEPDKTCSSDDDCGAGKICEKNDQGEMVCQPAECTSDDDCRQLYGEGYVCADCGRCTPQETPVCGDTKHYCDTSDQCGPNRVCNEYGKCIFQCGSDGDCPYGQVCSTDGLCVDDPNPDHADACVYSADCSDLPWCQENGCLCVNTYCQALCTSDDDCGDKQICDLGVCRADYLPE